MAVTDEFAFDPTLWVDGVNTMDQDEFVLLLERELSVNALLADKINLFSAFDLQGRLDQYGPDVPDGVLSFLEFSEAAQKCICKPGTALGRIMLPLNGIKWEFDFSITDRCQAYKVCAEGYFGVQCRAANYRLTRSLPRQSTLNGTTTVPIVYGRATFTDLSYFGLWRVRFPPVLVRTGRTSIFFGAMGEHLDKRFYWRRIYSQPV